MGCWSVFTRTNENERGKEGGEEEGRQRGRETFELEVGLGSGRMGGGTNKVTKDSIASIAEVSGVGLKEGGEEGRREGREAGGSKKGKEEASSELASNLAGGRNQKAHVKVEFSPSGYFFSCSRGRLDLVLHLPRRAALNS